MHIRLPDPFEPLRCLRQPGEGAQASEPPGAAAQPVLLRRQEYALAAELLAAADRYEVEPLCAAVRTALRRVVVQRAVLSPRGFDQRWERALWVCGEQTYKLLRGARQAALLGEAERREGDVLGRPGAAEDPEEAALRAAKAMLLGDLLELGAAARAALPGGEWEPFQLARLIMDGDWEGDGALGPSLSTLPPSPQALRPLLQ